MKKMTLEQIRQFWTEQAIKHGVSHDASWSDLRVIELEIKEIVSRLEDGDRVLDVGCANGFSTIQIASQKRVRIRGLDYIPEMIDRARTALVDISDRLVGDVEFDVGNIMKLEERDDFYDRIVVIRVLINLRDWGNQLHAVRECIRVLKPGGLLLLSEATLQGWQRMNKLRNEWKLPDIPMPDFNSYIDEKLLIDSVKEWLRCIEVCNFASTYFVGTRVLKPLFAAAVGGGINVADPTMEWNRFFAQLPAWGDYGTQKLFVFEKL